MIESAKLYTLCAIASHVSHVLCAVLHQVPLSLLTLVFHIPLVLPHALSTVAIPLPYVLHALVTHVSCTLRAFVSPVSHKLQLLCALHILMHLMYRSSLVTCLLHMWCNSCLNSFPSLTKNFYYDMQLLQEQHCSNGFLYKRNKPPDFINLC